MITLELLKTLYDYNYWAHRLVWDNSVMALSEHDFVRPLAYSIGSIHNQVVHTMSAEWIWTSRLGGTNPEAMLDPADFPTRAEVRTRWDEIEQEVRTFVNGLTDEDLNRRFTYQTTSGKQYSQSVAEVLLHVVNHGTDHRAQTLAMLHHLGAPTVEQDLIFYLRERDAE